MRRGHAVIVGGNDLLRQYILHLGLDIAAHIARAVFDRIGLLRDQGGCRVGVGQRDLRLGKRLGVYMDEPEIDNNMPYTYCPVINYYTGQKQYIVARDLRPIRN